MMHGKSGDTVNRGPVNRGITYCIYIIIVNARFQHLIIDYFDSQLLGIYLYAGAARDSMNLTFRTSIP